MMLQADRVHWQAQARRIVQDASVAVASGERVGLIGPNGSGKSSLLRLLYRVLRPAGGRVLLRGRDLWSLAPRAVAREVAVLAQEQGQAFDIEVHEAVMMGRLPHQSAWAADSAHDRACVRQALEQVGAWALAGRSLASLSGGERQRVLLARALAQQPALLLLDETTNHLDVRHQLELMGLLQRSGVASLVVLHDLNIAAHFCQRLYLMEQGRVVAQGTPAQVLTPCAIAQVYGVQAVVDTHPATGRPRISYVPQAPG